MCSLSLMLVTPTRSLLLGDATGGGECVLVDVGRVFCVVEAVTAAFICDASALATKSESKVDGGRRGAE